MFFLLVHLLVTFLSSDSPVTLTTHLNLPIFVRYVPTWVRAFMLCRNAQLGLLKSNAPLKLKLNSTFPLLLPLLFPPNQPGSYFSLLHLSSPFFIPCYFLRFTLLTQIARIVADPVIQDKARALRAKYEGKKIIIGVDMCQRLSGGGYGVVVEDKRWVAVEVIGGGGVGYRR